MNIKQSRIKESLETAVDCLSRPEFQTPRLMKATNELANAAAEIDKLYLKQANETAVLGTDGHRAKTLRNKLRKDHLMIISRRGKTLLKGIPGIEVALHVPHARANDAELQLATKRILDNVRPYAATFHEAKFAPDFIEQAQLAAKALDAAVKSPDTVVSRRSVAAHSLKHLLPEARELVEAIDSIVLSELARDRVALGVWKRAKRIPKKLGRPKRKPKKGD